MGAALARVLAELEFPPLEPGAVESWSYAAMFARACAHWHIDVGEAMQTYAWTWTENQVLAAVKLVPLGQSAGQRVLHRLIPRLRELMEVALGMNDDAIGISAVMHGFASARHETQYTRLFRS